MRVVLLMTLRSSPRALLPLIQAVPSPTLGFLIADIVQRSGSTAHSVSFGFCLWLSVSV